MKILSRIEQITRFYSRLGVREKVVADFLIQELKKLDAPFCVQLFDSQTPVYTKAELLADGKSIPCEPCGLVSGVITNNYNLISSLTSSQKFIDTPNINFNPRSDAICVSNFYFAPALAISRKDITKVMKAKTIQGEVEVVPQDFVARNILVGNSKNPKTIVFAHYDAYFAGATDNASGVAVVLDLIESKPEILKTTLFVLAGNEELSYDYPVYWGRCFREFMRAKRELMESCSSIVVVDSVGDGKPEIERESALIKLAFPIGDAETDILAKTVVLTGDFDRLMSVYHSAADTLDEGLSEANLQRTVQTLAKLCK